MNFKTILKRLQNTGTIISITSGVILIVTNLGYKVDNNEVMTIINTLCSVGVALGILNNPDTAGMDMPGITTKDK